MVRETSRVKNVSQRESSIMKGKSGKNSRGYYWGGIGKWGITLGDQGAFQRDPRVYGGSRPGAGGP